MQMVNEIFGSMLYRPISQHTTEFPSPESLKEKVLISTKPPEYPDSQEEKARENPQKLITSGEEETQGLENEEEVEII